MWEGLLCTQVFYFRILGGEGGKGSEKDLDDQYGGSCHSPTAPHPTFLIVSDMEKLGT